MSTELPTRDEVVRKCCCVFEGPMAVAEISSFPITALNNGIKNRSIVGDVLDGVTTGLTSLDAA